MVRSPAPPAIALLGLLGMLAGEQAVSLVGSHVSKGDAASTSSDRGEAATGSDVRGSEKMTALLTSKGVCPVLSEQLR
jgi:xanthosine utilization system XapX-like protein